MHEIFNFVLTSGGSVSSIVDELKSYSGEVHGACGRNIFPGYLQNLWGAGRIFDGKSIFN